MFLFVWYTKGSILKKRKYKRYTYHDAEWFFVFLALFVFLSFSAVRTYFIIKLHNYSFLKNIERWQLLGGNVNAVLCVLIADTCRTPEHRGRVGPGFPGVWSQGHSCFSKWHLFLPPNVGITHVCGVTVIVFHQLLYLCPSRWYWGESGDSVFTVRAFVYS